MERLSSRLLSTSLSRAKIKPQVEASQILKYLESLLVEYWGQRVATKAKALSLEDGAIRVAVLSSVLAGEVRLREHHLIKKINQRYSQAGVKKIVLEL